MIVWFFALLLAGAVSSAASPGQDENANSRYTVETVVFPSHLQSGLSRPLRDDLNRLVGEHLNSNALEELCKRLRQELRASSVSFKVQRGSQPEQLRIVFDIVRRRNEFELSVPKFVYHSRQGWTGAANAELRSGGNAFGFGMVSDGDELLERFTGLRSRYERKNFASDRLRPAIGFDSLRSEWNRATSSLAASAPGGGISYRARQSLTPRLQFQATPAITIDFGIQAQWFDAPATAARSGFSNALMTTLRYQRRIADQDANKQELAAEYDLRAATTSFGSDFSFRRHRAEARYAYTAGRNRVSGVIAAGAISGTAPLSDRFVLGNSTTLRGWNKYDLAPLGADRFAYVSAEYRYRLLQVFYDCGSIWNAGRPARIRQSAGIGLRKDNMALAVAFPLRDGRPEPMFFLGMNY